MEKRKRNQESQPSKAPRQDEEGQETVGSTNRRFGPADGNSDRQGISNRPAKDEHAFPAGDTSDSQLGPESVEDQPKQIGGNRGGV